MSKSYQTEATITESHIVLVYKLNSILHFHRHFCELIISFLDERHFLKSVLMTFTAGILGQNCATIQSFFHGEGRYREIANKILMYFRI